MNIKPTDLLALCSFIMGGLIALKKPKKIIGWFLIVASIGYLLFAFLGTDNQTKAQENQIQTITTRGDNSPVYAQSANPIGNNLTTIQAGPNATVNVGVSEATMLQLLKDKSIAANTEYMQKFPHGYALLGLANGKLVYEPNFNSIKVDADWEHITVQINHSNNSATFFLPHISIKSGNQDFEMSDNYFTVGYIDNKLTMVSLGVTAIWVEVLDVDKSIFLVGFK